MREWLPADGAAWDEALMGVIGYSDLLQADGAGGGSTLTSKVVIVWKPTQPDCDVAEERSVDIRPTCGNMLSGVAPSAIEQGLVDAADGETTARVFNGNTRWRVDAMVLTPGRHVTYAGETGIDGVAGRAAPIRLNFLGRLGLGDRPAVRDRLPRRLSSTALRSAASTPPCRR